eukprot:TRINITY_DN3276_c0_g1_i1.p1 TRINITY_DN3276_c0_g1~~TRINITY_DN3276_c0_g1_i1.p1  ORF type:complete len:671 (+),score=119.66 TRINITY_DN3276_c0_g1_i1:232-2013(+)
MFQKILWREAVGVGEIKSIPVSELTSVTPGLITAKPSGGAGALAAVTFSLVFKSRTLELEVVSGNPEETKRWVKLFMFLMNNYTTMPKFIPTQRPQRVLAQESELVLKETLRRAERRARKKRQGVSVMFQFDSQLSAVPPSEPNASLSSDPRIPTADPDVEPALESPSGHAHSAAASAAAPAAAASPEVEPGPSAMILDPRQIDHDSPPVESVASSAAPTPTTAPSIEPTSSAKQTSGAQPETEIETPVAEGHCAGCRKPISGQYLRLGAESFHVHCFVCAQCQQEFPEGKFISRNGKKYCQNDYRELFSEKCAGCKKPLEGSYLILQQNGESLSFHSDCFRCHHCDHPFSEGRYVEREGKYFCEFDYNKLFTKVCGVCLDNICLGQEMTLVPDSDKFFHKSCFKCCACKKEIVDTGFLETGGEHALNSAGVEESEDGDGFESVAVELWHTKCFRCCSCDQSFLNDKYVIHTSPPPDKTPRTVSKLAHSPINPPNALGVTKQPHRYYYCQADYDTFFKIVCPRCSQAIHANDDVFTLHENTLFHTRCVTCCVCSKSIEDRGFPYQGQFACFECSQKYFQELQENIDRFSLVST